MSRLQFPSTEAIDLSSDVRSGVDSRSVWLWALVGVACLLDVGLTYYGLGVGLEEGNPIARSFFSMLGVIEAMVLLKGVVIAFALVAWASVPTRYRPVVPIGVAIPWLVASGINAALILQV